MFYDHDDRPIDLRQRVGAAVITTLIVAGLLAAVVVGAQRACPDSPAERARVDGCEP